MLFRLTATLVAVIAVSAARVAALGGEPVVHRDLEYAEREDAAASQTSLDLYAPENAKNCPIVVWVHGGGWRIGDKRMVNHKPVAFGDRGIILASINYRLQPATDYRGQATDVADAVRWLADHAEVYGGDSQRMILMGHSAGAHLAALAVADAEYLKKAGVERESVCGVVLLDGAGYDVEQQMKQVQLMPRLGRLYHDAFGDEPAAWRDASPIHHVKDSQDYPPFLILHVASRPDSGRQSRALAEKLVAAGGQAEAVPCEGKTHATINREFGLGEDAPTKAAMEFIDEAFALQRPK